MNTKELIGLHNTLYENSYNNMTRIIKFENSIMDYIDI
jgi:hypothetical protein